MKHMRAAVREMESAVTIARATEASAVTALRVWRQGVQARRLMLLALRSRKAGRR